MTVDIARAAVITGDGVVARYPGLLCVARCSDGDVLLKLLDVCAGVAGSDPGRALARRLAKWMGGPDAPGDDLEFGTVATAGNQLGVFLVGSVVVSVPGSPVALSGSDAATWTDRLISVPGAPVVLALDGARPPADLADAINDLRAGAVPGAGAVLFPVGRAAAPRPDLGGVSALDGPTIRTAAHGTAAHSTSAHSTAAHSTAAHSTAGNSGAAPGAQNGAGQGGPARATVAHDVAVQNGAGSNGVVRNGTPRNGTPRNGAPSLLADEAPFDGDPAAEGPRDRRPGSRNTDPRTPNGYEWFADWSETGVPPDPAAVSDTSGPDPTGPDATAPAVGRWPWNEPPADPGHARPADEPVRAQESGPGDPDDLRTGGVDGGRPGRATWTAPPTPPGGSGLPSPVDDRAPVWVDPADPALRDEPADQLQEGRHAILGSDLPPAIEDEASPPAGSPAAAFAGPPPVEIEQVEHREAAPPPADLDAHFEGADDATPVNAVAAVEPEPTVEETPEVPETEPRPALDDRAPDIEEAPTPPPRPGRAPAPAPRPQDQTGPGEILPEPDEPLLHGLLCEDGHLNDPRSSSCVVCGAPVEPGEDVVGPRPPLGRIVFDDGATFTVDAEYLVGRMPEADPRARSGELQPIVVEDRSGSVSRVHAEILINGWDVVLVDSGSRNGTFVAGPDENGWTPLAPGRTSLLLPGTRVRMGGRTFVFEPPVAVG